MKILICEDDPMTLKAIDTKMKREGYETITALDGKVAEEIITSGKFDMLITDLLMPYMTGLELVYLMRKELKLKQPIIALTSISIEDTVLKTFYLGVDDYVIKPFSLNELAFRVKLIFRRRAGTKEHKFEITKPKPMTTKTIKEVTSKPKGKTVRSAKPADTKKK